MRSGEDLEDVHGGGPVQSADIEPGFVEPLDFVRQHLPGKIFGFKAELSQNIFHRDAFATQAQAAAIFLGDLFVIGRGG